MSPHLVYMSGEPGVGKSTLMGDLTAAWRRHPLPDAPARDLLLAPGTLRPLAVELGRRRDAFAGTDALPSAVIGAAEHYVRSGRAADEAPLLLAEGARLANLRFLRAATDTGYTVTLLHLYGERVAAARRAARAHRLGRPEQNDAWVRGRRTAAVNLANAAPDLGVRVVPVDVDRLHRDGDDSPYAHLIAREWAAALGERGPVP
jgi:hypothetical protein